MEAQVATARAETAALGERMTTFQTAIARDLNRSRANGRDTPYMIVPAFATGKEVRLLSVHVINCIRHSATAGGCTATVFRGSDEEPQ